jgi:tetratricopeptide (TPR) repeat protein
MSVGLYEVFPRSEPGETDQAFVRIKSGRESFKMHRSRGLWSLVFGLVMLLGFPSWVAGEGFGLYYLYFKNGNSMRCDAIWQGMGDFVWCGNSLASQGFPVGEVDMNRTFTVQAEVSRLVDKSLDEFSKGDWDQAINAATSAIALDPSNEVAYANRAGAYSKKGMYQEAIQDCNRAIEANPNFGLAYNNRGYARYKIGQFDEALADYDMSCRLGNSLGCNNYERLKYVLELIGKK